MELSLLILVCIHKSYIVYLEIYVVPIGYGFSFFGHGKSNVKKEGAPCVTSLALVEVCALLSAILVLTYICLSRVSCSSRTTVWCGMWCNTSCAMPFVKVVTAFAVCAILQVLHSCIVISSSEMLKPHWLKSSHVTGTINAYCFFSPTGAL